MRVMLIAAAFGVASALGGCASKGGGGESAAASETLAGGGKMPAGISDTQFRPEFTGSPQASIRDVMSKRGWQMLSEQPGLTVAKFSKANNRSPTGTSSVTVNVKYDADSFSVDYVDSEGMKYNPNNGKINKVYNRWIGNIRKDLSYIN